MQGMLGYLNYSTGKPDGRFQKQLSDAYGFLAEAGNRAPWQQLSQALLAKLDALQAQDAAAFREAEQARTLLSSLFPTALGAYRDHHADLLGHLDEADLFQPFFLARVFEALLSQGPPWTETDRIVAGAVSQLNDFIGHRPIAILETRPRGEPYDHERVRPIPLFMRGAGVAWGRHHDLVTTALDILKAADPAIRADASFDLDLLDELSVDPRAFDQGHPVNRRPNYKFGEWDPHHLDNQGRYRRFVVRDVLLAGLASRIDHAGELPCAEVLFEAGAVLAGTILMAAGISGSSPTSHDSTASLARLMPSIAHYRERFYDQLLQRMSSSHGERLRQEAATTRQPFGRARQHLNEYLSRHQAAQLQQRHLALLFASMGYPQASDREARKVPAVSVRMLVHIVGRLVTGQLLAERSERAAAARVLPEVESLLHRGIACGALADPWNILGFQALFPLATAQEDSVRDTRIDDLTAVVQHLFDLYSRLLSDSAAAGEKELTAELGPSIKQLAAWWDQFASVEVQDVRRIHGGEAAESARQVAAALQRWQAQGGSADLAFWKRQLDHFRSPKAFALVVEALLRRPDHRAAMALLISWLSQAEQVPLNDGMYSFHPLALRWMLEVTRQTPPDLALIRKFFDYLEANAEDYGQVPLLESAETAHSEADEPEENLYGAAYEDVTYQDSTDDDQEGEVLEGGPPQKDFDLDFESQRLPGRLLFLATLARLWTIAAQFGANDRDQADALASWLTAARTNYRRLLALLDALHAFPIPAPLGSYDSLVEFDRRRLLKERLLEEVIGTALNTALAVGTLRGQLGEPVAGPAGSSPEPQQAAPPWEPLALRIERALRRGDDEEIRTILPTFVENFQNEPLLFSSLSDGGHPRQILRARLAQSILRVLVVTLPRLGLLRETFELLRTAQAMEQANPLGGRGVTEFNHLFHVGFQAVVDNVLDAAATWASDAPDPAGMISLLEKLTAPFLGLWFQHSQTLQLSVLETIRADADWTGLRDFIRRYGGDLFHARFMTLANLRGILHRGIDGYLDFLAENPDPLHPVHLIDDLDQQTPRAQAVRYLHWVIQAVVDNYEQYKDYNSSTAQSDYGQNLYVLLDFLRLKAGFERHAWQFRPLAQVHERLARKDQRAIAVRWQEAFSRGVHVFGTRHLEDLDRLEQAHGVRLRTIRDYMEEGLERPLVLDRSCALIGPAMAEAGQGGGPAFALLEQQLQQHAAIPTGAGLDVPPWIRRLEQEVHRVQVSRSTLAALAEDLFTMPQKLLSLPEFRQLVEQWDARQSAS
jgi:hypothetical protein